SVEAKEVTWVAMEPGLLGERLKQGEFDAVATSDPLGTILEGNKITKTIADQAKDQPYADEYCCAVVVNGEFARTYPTAAEGVTDEWILAQNVERINGARPPRLAANLFAAMFDGGKGGCLCCNRCCIE